MWGCGAKNITHALPPPSTLPHLSPTLPPASTPLFHKHYKVMLSLKSLDSDQSQNVQEVTHGFWTNKDANQHVQMQMDK